MCKELATVDNDPNAIDNTDPTEKVPLSNANDTESETESETENNETYAPRTNGPSNKPSRNIRLTLIYTVVAFASRSLWSQSVLSTFVYLLRENDPKAVGFIAGSMGIAQLLCSFPTGIIADHYRRDHLLKVASVVGVLATIFAFIALWKKDYVWLVVALSTWGMFWGISNTSITALFADSIKHGQRSQYFTQRSIMMKLGNMTGPIAALLLFALLGNEWTVQDCAYVMAAGNGICIPALILLCFLSDEHGEDDQDDHEYDAISPLLISSSMEEEENAEVEQRRQCLPESRIVPIMVSTMDLISGLGAGMSIRYFPIFFLDNLKMSPVMVQTLYILSPIGQTFLIQYGQLWSKSIGRCHVTLIYKWIGITFMFLMIASYHWNLPHWLTCVFYVVRTCFMNGTAALTKSMLMDSVPKEERGKWTSLESVNTFGWSGSAVLGGLLVGRFGILSNFCVTGSIQCLATIPILALLSRDHIEGAPRRTVVSSENDADTEDPEESSKS